MAYWGDFFPWSNFHELNLDWIIMKMKEFERKFPELEKEFQDLEKVVNDLKETISQIADPEQLQNMLKNIEQNSKDIALLSKEILEIHGDISEINATIMALTSNVQGIHTTISAIQAEQTTQNTNIQNNANNIATASQEIADLQTEVGQFKTSYNTDQQRQDEELNDYKTTVAAEQKAQDDKIAANTLAISTLSSGITGDLTDVTNRIVALETSQQTQDTNITALQTSQTAQDQSITALGNRVTDNDQELSELHTILNGQATEIASLQSAVTGLNNDFLYQNIADLEPFKFDGSDEGDLLVSAIAKSRGCVFIPESKAIYINHTITLTHFGYFAIKGCASSGLNIGENCTININATCMFEGLWFLYQNRATPKQHATFHNTNKWAWFHDCYFSQFTGLAIIYGDTGSSYKITNCRVNATDLFIHAIGNCEINNLDTYSTKQIATTLNATGATRFLLSNSNCNITTKLADYLAGYVIITACVVNVPTAGMDICGVKTDSNIVMNITGNNFTKKCKIPYDTITASKVIRITGNCNMDDYPSTGGGGSTAPEGYPTATYKSLANPILSPSTITVYTNQAEALGNFLYITARFQATSSEIFDFYLTQQIPSAYKVLGQQNINIMFMQYTGSDNFNKYDCHYCNVTYNSTNKVITVRPLATTNLDVKAGTLITFYLKVLLPMYND